MLFKRCRNITKASSTPLEITGATLRRDAPEGIYKGTRDPNTDVRYVVIRNGNITRLLCVNLRVDEVIPGIPMHTATFVKTDEELVIDIIKKEE